jgi:hypothetical protein
MDCYQVMMFGPQAGPKGWHVIRAKNRLDALLRWTDNVIGCEHCDDCGACTNRDGCTQDEYTIITAHLDDLRDVADAETLATARRLAVPRELYVMWPRFESSVYSAIRVTEK